VQEVNDPILTAEEVAEDLRISKSHVHKLLRGQVEGAKTLPHLAVGRRKVVPRSALERWKRDSISDYGERDG
jgi:excisionase family DNA binding protein